MTGPAAAPRPFPLSAVVGQDDLKLALLLCAVDHRLGGVLIRGEKGSGKSTAARGLAALQAGAPFVELPVGATEDRVIGSLDLEGALVDGERRLQPGLLASAHGGVLYVDEVNLLPDHLVDVLVDAAASGVNHVERDGLAVTHPCRFVLAGSMNPEEGELRPQLLDRFGLAVEVRAPADPGARAEVVRRRLAYDADPGRFGAAWSRDEAALAEALTAASGRLDAVTLDDAVVDLAAGICAELGAEGLRADLVLARGARALAALEGRDAATADDVVRLAPLALAHRRRRGPFDAPGLEAAELAEALDRLAGDRDARGEPAGAGGSQDADAAPTAGTGAGNSDRGGDSRSDARGSGRASAGETAGDTRIDGGSPARPRPPVGAGEGAAVTLSALRPSGAAGRRQRGPAPRGGMVAARAPDGPLTDLAVGATAVAAAARRATDPQPASAPRLVTDDLRQAVREARTANLAVLVVDASGSMGTQRRMEAAKGAALSLLLDAYQRRDRVALVTFAGEGATVVLRPTGSVEVARARLDAIPTGGHTPLAAGLRAGLEVARQARRTDPGRRPVLVVVTDGRATGGPDRRGPDPAAAALLAGAEVAGAGIEAMVVDAEDGPVRLGLAATLAEVMGARLVALPRLTGTDLAGAVSGVLDAH